MKKSILIIKAVTIITALIVCAIALSSCQKAEKSVTVYYNSGFSTVEGGNNVLTEMGLISDSFLRNVGKSTDDFTLTGTISDCDAIVKAAGAKTKSSLDGSSWTCTLVFQVTNVNTGNVVFSYSVKPVK